MCITALLQNAPKSQSLILKYATKLFEVRYEEPESTSCLVSGSRG